MTGEGHNFLMNLHVRAIIVAFLVIHHDVRDGSTASRIGALENRVFAVGDDGRRRGQWLNIIRECSS
jgi:hypothetical protein